MRTLPAALVGALLSLSLSTTTALAGADPLKSPECGRSIAALQAARAGSDTTAEVEALRRQAILACLGGSGEARRPSPTARPPVVVAPPVIEVPPEPQAPVAAPAPPPLEIERPPPVVTSCDAGGCWTSDGTRLNRAGPQLIGPGGACVTSGNVVRCP